MASRSTLPDESPSVPTKATIFYMTLRENCTCPSALASAWKSILFYPRYCKR